MVRPDHFESEIDFRRYETLLGTADLLVRHSDLPALFLDLTQQLRTVTDCEEACFSLYDPRKSVMRVHVADGPDEHQRPFEVPADQSISGWVWHAQRPLVIPRQKLDKPCFPRAIEWLKKKGLNSYCTLPLTASQRLGTIGLGSKRADSYHRDELDYLQRIAGLMAVAVENVTAKAALQSEEERLRLLLDVGAVLNSAPDLQTIFPTIAQAVRKVIRPDIICLKLYARSDHTFRTYALDGSQAENLSHFGSISFDQAISAPAFASGRTRIFTIDELRNFDSSLIRLKVEQGIRSACALPLIHGTSKLGVLVLLAHADDQFLPEDVMVMEQIAAQLAITLDREGACRERDELSNELRKESAYPKDKSSSIRGFEEIVGESPALKRVLTQVATVAPTDATVLLLGETGTGKELLARAIHRLSSRGNAEFIKLNCAAIPTGLLESELFGHEKGAFTGAVSQKIGRLEIADQGTLFLDEVGDILPELQPKLLRVLQDQEFERLGGTRTIRVNVRLIAATNKDLAMSVLNREFRSDLYYRLNVFPIVAPPLRERGEDIILLVRYFVQKYARQMH